MFGRSVTPALRCYGVAVLVGVPALLLVWLIPPRIQPNVSFLLFAAMSAVAWSSVLAPGLFTILAAAFTCACFFLSPSHRVVVAIPGALIESPVFVRPFS